MESLVNSEKSKWQELDDTLTQLKQECDQLNTQLTEFSAGVPGLQDEYNKLDGSVSPVKNDLFKSHFSFQFCIDLGITFLRKILNGIRDDVYF